MKNRVFLILFLGSFFLMPAHAQFSGESEMGTDGKGDGFFSQYVFYDWSHSDVWTRYVVVNHGVNRGEFSIGSTFHFAGTKLAMQLGADTDRDVQLAGYVSGKTCGHDWLYIADQKLATRSSLNSTLYEKLFVGLTKKGRIQFRLEDLCVGYSQGFLRVSLEYRKNLSSNAHVAVAPFYDPLKHSFGGQLDFRFFNFRPRF